LWFTDPFYGGESVPDDHELELTHRFVYRADPTDEDEWTLTRMTYDTTNPNGPLVSPGDEHLYVAQYDNRTSFVVTLFDGCSRLPTTALRLGKWMPRERLSIDTKKPSTS